VIGGGPGLGDGPITERVAVFRERYDEFRSAVVNEPRGSDVFVGALLCEPSSPESAAGVIFFNNVGYLGMCGHGAIGVAATLEHLGRIRPGDHWLETPAGTVCVSLHGGGEATVRNVPSYRARKDVEVEAPGYGAVRGDVAWGGNWFFLVNDHGMRIALDNVDALTNFAWSVRQALASQGVTGADGGEIDHIELLGPPDRDDADSKNFVLCPGKAYDRSPCGTGTSAKLACLVADGKLGEGGVWRQESIVGSLFRAQVVKVEDGKVLPAIRGCAYVNAEASLILDPRDPFQMGIRR